MGEEGALLQLGSLCLAPAPPKRLGRRWRGRVGTWVDRRLGDLFIVVPGEAPSSSAAALLWPFTLPSLLDLQSRCFGHSCCPGRPSHLRVVSVGILAARV